MLNDTVPLEPALAWSRWAPPGAILSAALVLSAFALMFLGYPLGGMNFSDFHFYERDLPPLWGLSIEDPQTHAINYGFLYHNEGLMALLYYLLNHLPLEIPDKLIFVNGLTIVLQLVNVWLFVCVMQRLVGPSRLFPYLLLFLLYPYAAANRYWQACLANNVAAAFFLASLLVFLRIDYAPDKLGRNLVRFVLPSLALLWCSIITVEYAVCLPPLYVYLALYYSNGRAAVLRFPRWITPYSAVACLFLLTSLLPVLLFSGHRLTAFSYATRFNDLAAQTHWAAPLVGAAVIGGNGLLTYASYFFANTLGVLVYPLDNVARHWASLGGMPVRHLAALATVVALGLVGLRAAARLSADRAREGEFDPRFLLTVGSLWMLLAYFPFSLSFGYPRNVGLTADRINTIGGIGAVVVLGTGVRLMRARFNSRRWLAAVGGVILLLAAHIQIQKLSYAEAGRKEEAVIEAVFERDRLERETGSVPIFLLRREAQLVTPRARLGLALRSPSLSEKVQGVASFVVGRYFIEPTATTSFHFDGIFFFWCCPQTASYTFDFYADWRDVPRPLVYKWEDPLTIEEEAEEVTIGYGSADGPSALEGHSDLRSFAKNRHPLIAVDLGETTFTLGGPLALSFRPFTGRMQPS